MLIPDDTYSAILLVVSCHSCLSLYASMGRVPNKDLRKYFCNQHVDDDGVKFLEPKINECRICQQRTCGFCEKCGHLRDNPDNGKKIKYESVVYDGRKGKNTGIRPDSNKMMSDFNDLKVKIDLLKNSNILEICLEKLIQEKVESTVENNENCHQDDNPNELEDFDLTRFKNEISAQSYIELEKHTFGRQPNKNDIKYNSGELIHNLFLESTKRQAQFQSVKIEKLPDFKGLFDFTLETFQHLSIIAESQAKTLDEIEEIDFDEAFEDIKSGNCDHLFLKKIKYSNLTENSIKTVLERSIQPNNPYELCRLNLLQNIGQEKLSKLTPIKCKILHKHPNSTVQSFMVIRKEHFQYWKNLKKMFRFVFEKEFLKNKMQTRQNSNFRMAGKTQYSNQQIKTGVEVAKGDMFLYSKHRSFEVKRVVVLEIPDKSLSSSNYAALVWCGRKYV